MSDFTYLINRATFVAESLAENPEFHASEECSPGWSGGCDGYDYEYDCECACPCHTGEDPLFEVSTLRAVAAAHSTMWLWGAV